MKILILVYFIFCSLNLLGQKKQFCDSTTKDKTLYTMPAESLAHEGTWLQWPHHYQYGLKYRKALEPTWLSMTKYLITSENVHLIVYDLKEKARITTLLKTNQISLQNIDFTMLKTDDVWIRDNGPIFVKNRANQLLIEDWGFNAWGKDAKYKKCDLIPEQIASKLSLPSIDLYNVTLEGGAFETDGRGTLIATRSSITHRSRNPKYSELKIESYLTKYLGVTNIIWLDGKYGTEITDMHIDGILKFANDSTLVTMSAKDLIYWGLSSSDISIINSVRNVNEVDYKKIYIPLTAFEVKNTSGKSLGYKGSYCNYYIANTVVLVPNYNDPNDEVANKIIQKLYPLRKVIGIDVRNLYENGGMIHCVTMQQPKRK